jgi:hypothetical protein
MSIESNDVTGSPMKIEELRKLVATIQAEAVKGDHSLLFKDGTPAMMVWFDLNVALKELIYLREAIEKNKRGKS